MYKTHLSLIVRSFRAPWVHIFTGRTEIWAERGLEVGCDGLSGTEGCLSGPGGAECEVGVFVVVVVGCVWLWSGSLSHFPPSWLFDVSTITINTVYLFMI